MWSSRPDARSSALDVLCVPAAAREIKAPDTPKNFAKAGLASTILPSPLANATPTGASRNTSPIPAAATGTGAEGAAVGAGDFSTGWMFADGVDRRGVNHHAVCP